MSRLNPPSEWVTADVPHLRIVTNELWAAVERRVLTTLQEKLLDQDLFAEFCQEFTREMNRLRMAARANITTMQQELVRVERGIARFIQAIKDGVPGRDVREPMLALSERKEEPKRLLQEAPEPTPLLHVGMAEIYRQKVMNLRAALEQEDARPRAVEALRGLLEAIIFKPEGNRLGITVQGNLAAMLPLAHNAKRPSDADDLQRSVTTDILYVHKRTRPNRLILRAPHRPFYRSLPCRGGLETTSLNPAAFTRDQLIDLMFAQQGYHHRPVAAKRGPHALAPIVYGFVPFGTRWSCQDVAGSHPAAIPGEVHDWPVALATSEVHVHPLHLTTVRLLFNVKVQAH